MPGSELVQSLSRGLEILQIAGKSENGIRVTDAADALGMKFPTVHNLIKTLVAKKFLIKTDSNTYVLGNIFQELAEASFSKSKYAAMSSLIMKISEDIPDATVVYADESQGHILTRLRIHPQNPRVLQKPDSIMKIYSTSSGLTYLAFGNPEIKEDLMRESPFHEDGVNLWKSFARLENFLTDSVKKSYVSPDFEGALRRAVSIPVYSDSGILRGALGVTVDIDANIEKRVKKLASYLHDAVSSIKIK